MLALKLLSGLWSFFNPFDKGDAAEIVALLAMQVYVGRHANVAGTVCPLEQWKEWDDAVPNIVLYVDKETNPALVANDACVLSELQTVAIDRRVKWLRRSKLLKLSACVVLTASLTLLKLLRS